MDSDKLFAMLEQIYVELQLHSKNINGINSKFNNIENGLKEINEKIDTTISIKNDILTMLNKSKKSF